MNQKHQTTETTSCFHCGEKCETELIQTDDHDFCCEGCKTVYTLLQGTGLSCYYNLNEPSPGTTISSQRDNKDYLDLEEVKDKLISFRNGAENKVTFYVPSMHCAACIWLLEKLDKLNPGISRSEVNFIRKELTVFFNTDHTSLKDLVILLENLGYAPDLKRDSSTSGTQKASGKHMIKLGIAGFAFGNIMLFSFPEYLSIDDASLHMFKPVFGYLSLLLSLPVLLYSDTDYLRSAWNSLRLRYLTIDVPIALGILTLFGRSAYEVISGTGAGYFDSFAGLIFFLLIGRWYQNRTYEALAFDRDFKSYFPIAVSKIVAGEEEVCMLEHLRPGDRIQLYNNQVIPADSILMKGVANIDYSFVNGESELVEKQQGSLLYAGGRNTGGPIQLEVVKAVNQSYLTSLWNQSIFEKDASQHGFSEMITKVSQRFSYAILIIAFASLFYWLWNDPSKAVDAFTAVLIIACPCALAMSMPFASGSVTRILGKLGFFIKNSATLERIANIDTIVFDKTGTLTKADSSVVTYHGVPMGERDKRLVKSVLAASTHPLSIAIRNHLSADSLPLEAFRELAGSGISAKVESSDVVIGSADFVMQNRGFNPPKLENKTGSEVHVVIEQQYCGAFLVEKEFREGLNELIKELKTRQEVHLLSGDNEQEQPRVQLIFGQEKNLLFRQSPMDKLNYIKQLETSGKRVMMMGDGLNDAGALKQASVGIAVADDVFSFSPACDAILQASQLQNIAAYIAYIRKSMAVVKMAVVISLLYNCVGLFFAVQSQLTPVIAAVLMPMSSVSVIVFVSLTTYVIRPQKSTS